jgi:hypothetical protein
MCSAGLAFVLGAGLRAALDEKLDVRPWLDLVALGTIADVAPLTGDNRTLVRAGLDRIAAGKARPGVLALLERASVREGTRPRTTHAARPKSASPKRRSQRPSASTAKRPHTASSCGARTGIEAWSASRPRASPIVSACPRS